MITMHLKRNENEIVEYDYRIWESDKPDDIGKIQYNKIKNEIVMLERAKNDKGISSYSNYSWHAFSRLIIQAETGEFPEKLISIWQ